MKLVEQVDVSYIAAHQEAQHWGDKGTVSYSWVYKLVDVPYKAAHQEAQHWGDKGTVSWDYTVRVAAH